MTKLLPLTVALVAFLLLLPPANAKIQTIHQDLTVRLDPAARSLTVLAKLAIDGHGPLTFRLAKNFVVTTFTVDGENAAAKRIGNRWIANLPGDRRHDIVLNYHGALAPSPTTSGPFATVEPVSSVGGSFLPGGSGWHPSFDGRRFSYRLDVSVPKPQRAVAPGRLIDERTTGADYRAVFESEAPLDGIVLMAGPYRITERHHGKTRIRTYFHPDIAALAEGYLEATSGYLDFYERWIGPYPYSAFHIVSGLLPVGLGYPGLTFMGKRVLALPFIRSSSLGHEILHNWWGNAVRVDYAAGNWSEGLTTFMADYTYARQRSENDARAMRIGWLRDYAALPAARDHPVISFVSRSHDAEQVIGYNKVAFIFHMLRRNIGEQAFNRGIKLFWRHRAFTTASWGDLQNAFEEASRRDLGTFFRQWLEQSGAPKLVLKRSGAHGNMVSFDLAQPASDYILSVPVDIETSTGRERFEAKIKGGRNHFDITTTSPALGLTIDPDFDVFRRLDPAETPPILRDVTLAAETRIIVPTKQDEFLKLATGLAGRLLDTGSGRSIHAAAADTPLPATPLLVIGTPPDIDAFLARHGFAATPADIANRGTARAWVTRTSGPDGTTRPTLLIEADSSRALQAISGPLPHYRRQGYVVFDGSKAIAKGVRPAGHGPLSVQFK